MSKKYELTSETAINPVGATLYRIKALRDFYNIKAGDLGGFVQSEANLSHEDLCWVFGNALVFGNARVYKQNDVITLSGFGEEARTTTAFKTEDSFAISCGDFYGTLDKFRADIANTPGDNKFGREYKLVADLIELHFSEE